ncbi:MAG: HAMP domain-containing histidine kinase [Alphaproteobacteria bacterium]|nr:HAMP domain-containing histidine kinase [Alphaproteobacteria bacterium]
MPELDIRTLALASAFAPLTLSVGMLLLRRILPHQPGVALWAVGGLLIAAGALLIAGRGLLPDALSIVVANASYVAGHVALLAGIEQFQGRRVSWRTGAVALGAAAVGLLYFALLDPNTDARILIVSLAAGWLSALIAFRLAGPGRMGRAPEALLAALFGVHALFYGWRGLYVTLDGAPTGDFMAVRGGIHLLVYFDAILLMLTCAVGFTLMATTRLHRALEREVAEKNRLISILAHDLRSPFTGLVGFTDLITLQLKAGRPERAKEYAEELSQAARGVLGLLEDLLLWARATARRARPEIDIVDLEALVERATAVLRAEAKERQVTVAADLQVTRARAAEIHAATVLRNLLSNALKFCRPGDRITVSTRREDGRVVLQVADSGVGLPDGFAAEGGPDEIPDQRPGLRGETGGGVGLALCRDLCRADGERLWLASNPGGGALAAFTLRPAD